MAAVSLLKASGETTSTGRVPLRLAQLQVDHRLLSTTPSTSRNCAVRRCGHSRSTYRSPTANSIGA